MSGTHRHASLDIVIRTREEESSSPRRSCNGVVRVPTRANTTPTSTVAGTGSGGRTLASILCRPLPRDLPPTDNPAQLHWRKVNRRIRAERQRVAAEGMGEDLDTIHRLCRDDAEALSLLDEATAAGPGPKQSVDNINSSDSRPTGTSRQQALRKLRKDAPEVHAEVIAGESGGAG